MTNDSQKDRIDLEDRFLEPPGWRWHTFSNARGRKMRFGTVAPESHIPDAIIIVLPGLSEFGEKYFELAHDLLDRNLSMWVIDWQGQGKSERHLKNPHKRHSNSFDEDIADLHFFLMEYVKHAAVHPDVGRIPLIMLGHSMGANIGLRYLHRHPDMFAAAAFSAPLMGINSLRALPSWLALSISEPLSSFFGHSYVPGGNDWEPRIRPRRAKGTLTSDKTRSTIHDAWSTFDPALQVGNVTFGWVHEALVSCARLRKKNVLRDIHTPCLLALAEQDRLVDNARIKKAAKVMPHATLVELPGSYHEILMETDGIRNSFLNAFDELLTVNKIKEKVKPF